MLPYLNRVSSLSLLSTLSLLSSPSLYVMMTDCSLYGSVVVAQLCRFDEVNPVPLAKCVHIHKVLPLHLIGLPAVSQDMIPSCLLILLRGQIRNSMLIFYITKLIPTGNMIFLISK